MALTSRERAAAALIFVLTAALFSPALGHDWLNYDDDLYITDNPHLANGLSLEGVRWAFSSFLLANWFPLTWLSWMLDVELFGLAPSAFHAANALLHALASATLYAALVRMTGCAGRSAFVAAVFAVHPLHVESVAWAAARKDPLSGLFWMLALLVYAGQGREGPSPRRLLAVGALLVLGLMSKPTLVTLPFALLLLDAWPLGRLRDPGALRRAVLEKLPLLAAAALLGVVALRAQASGGALVDLERLGVAARMGNALLAYAAYLGKALWPTGLAVIYPHPGEALPAARVAAAGALLAGITVLSLAAARRLPFLAVGWLWYLGTLVPVIGLVQVGSQAMADRYTYLPLIGLALAVAWGVPALLARAAGERTARRLSAAAGALAVAALCAATAAQLRHWRDSTALFEHAVRVTRDNHIAHAQLGAAHMVAARLDEAIEHYSESIRLRPDNAEVANDLAWVLATHPDPARRNPYLAVRLAERAAALTHHSDPNILDTLAAAYAVAKRFDDAVRTAETGLAVAEAQGDALLTGVLRQRLSRYRGARGDAE